MRVLTSALILWNILAPISNSSFPGHSDYQGCFNLLHGGTFIRPSFTDDCFKFCSDLGSHHAGLYHTKSACYCDDELMSMTSKVDNALCKPCQEDNTLICGGNFHVSVYEIKANMTIANKTIDQQEIESAFEEEPLILLAGKGGIYSYNFSANEVKTVIKVDYPVDALDYHLSKKQGFAIWDQTIYRFPLLQDTTLSENHTECESVFYVDRCPTFAVDWVHRKLYYPDCNRHFIMAISLDDTLDFDPNATDDFVVEPPEGAWAMDMVVDPYKGLLFWTTGATLWSVRLDGRFVTKLVPAFPVNRVSALSLDLAAERVYFSGTDKHDKNTSRIYFADYNGLTSHSLQFHEYDGGIYILSFGIYDHHIYFIKRNDRNFSAVMTSKLEYNQRSKVVFSGEHTAVHRLRLVHPRLQAPGKVDECTNYGCSHLCVVEASLAQCYCPSYHHLDHDNRTCFLNPGEGEIPLILEVAGGLMLVLIVILGAGVLMCMCDKLWSHLHPTVVNLSLPGAAKRTFNGQRREDGENLI